MNGGMLDENRGEERAYSILLLELNKLFRAGTGDDAEADRVRDGMDSHWNRMNEAQQQRMRWLTVDLEDLETTKGIRQESKSESGQWANELRAAYASNTGDRNDHILALLRDARAYKPAGYLPYLQGRFYERLGLPEIALVFFEVAEPLNSQFQPITLHFLQQQGWMGLAVPKAERLLMAQPKDPIAVYFACGVLLDSVRHFDIANAKPTLERIRRSISNSIATLESLKVRGPEQEEIYPASVVLLGACLEKLGDHKAVVSVYDRYLSSCTNGHATGDIYALRGIAKEHFDHQSAILDFRKAVNLRTSSPWPYLYVVGDHLRFGKPKDAIPICNHALNFLPGIPDIAKALLYEHLAIALARSGQSKQWVLENFDRAIDLAPNEEHIRANRALAASSDSLVLHIPTDLQLANADTNSSQRIANRFSIRASNWTESEGLQSVA